MRIYSAWIRVESMEIKVDGEKANQPVGSSRSLCWEPHFHQHVEMSDSLLVSDLDPTKVHLLLLEHEAELDDEMLSRLIPWEPEEREIWFSYRQRAARTSWCMARFFISRFFEANATEHSNNYRIERGPFGKPFLNTGEWQFNLSHSLGCVALAATSQIQVGCDIECLQPPSWDYRPLMAEHFSRPEREWVLAGKSSPDTWERFLVVYVQKEAVLKASGVGLFAPPRGVRAALQALPFRTASRFCLRFGANPGYIVAVSTLSPPELEESLSTSQDKLHTTLEIRTHRYADSTRAATLRATK